MREFEYDLYLYHHNEPNKMILLRNLTEDEIDAVGTSWLGDNPYNDVLVLMPGDQFETEDTPEITEATVDTLEEVLALW